MPGEPSENRHRFAVDLLAAPAGATVLEFGAGTGAGSAQVLANDPAARVVVVDRSATAVARIGLRLADELAEGRVTLLDVELAALELPEGSVDAAFGVNVNAFWMTMALRESAALMRALAPGAPLVVAYGADPTGSPTRARATLASVAANLTSGGFLVEREVVAAEGSAVVARRP